VYPRATGLNDTHLRLALAYAVLANRTGSRLHRAKAEALANAALVAQNPLSGQIPFDLSVDSSLRPWGGPGFGDGGNRQEYGTLALMRLAQLWEPAKNTPPSSKP